MAFDTHPAAGTYFPAAARNDDMLANLTVQGMIVRADVDVDGAYTVFAGDEVAATGTLNGTEGDLMVFFTAEAMLWSMGVDMYREERAAAESVAGVREAGTDLLARATELEAQGEGPIEIERTRNGRLSGRRVITVADPRHPARAARALRAQAAVLAAWTMADEDGYVRYVTDGLADTDGHFVPLNRAAWVLGR